MKVRCIDAKDWGIPLKEGETYTVRTQFSEAPDWGREEVEGYTLCEVGGRFLASRFVVIN
jgi:predicted RNA-binding protein with TRAM domain